MPRPILLTFGFLTATLNLSACSDDSIGDHFADTVLVNGKIYTMDADRTWAEAVAVKNGIIVKVGTSANIRTMADDGTEVIDLQGRMVLPGLHDTHIHINGGESVFAEGYCKLPDSTTNVTADELYGLIEKCRDEDPDATGWFLGGGWPGGAFPPDGAPDKAPLDALFPDRPVFLTADSHHVAWANSKALKIAGITKDTPDPKNGSIKRDPSTGEATGTLFESAQSLVGSKIPSATAEQKDAALYRVAQYANSLGITSVFQAAAREENLASFDRL